MAGEQVEGLPDALREWVESRAAETGRDPNEVLVRAAAAYRLLDEHEELLPEPSGADAAAVDELADRVNHVERRVDGVEATLDEKIDDVRDRIVQVKRETDAKAEADHDHPELRQAAETATVLADDLEDLRDDLDALETKFEDGFANYEDVLEYLTDTAEEHDEKLLRLASVYADVKNRFGKLEAREARRRAADELKREANRAGVEAAACAACNSKVRLGLLTAPECPHCGGTFEGIEPASGFFGSATLTVGERPALEGDVAEELEPEDVFEEHS
ncbi:CopG family transcriptional regulator [Halobaculum sp. D14]|uniref:CopG family transcriptional regulator n=1 Tax=Halobaculum sp. D14 TaxID=3421642 RepID=UPI003EB8D84C